MRSQVCVSSVKAGDKLKVDAGFSCILPYAVVDVFADETGDLYVLCGDGRHYLESQLEHVGDEAHGHYVGFEKVS